MSRGSCLTNQVVSALLAEVFKAHALEVPQGKVSAGSIPLRNHLLATGRFLSVLPDSVLRHNAKQWSLKGLPIDLGVKPRSIAIVTLKHRTVSQLPASGHQLRCDDLVTRRWHCVAEILLNELSDEDLDRLAFGWRAPIIRFASQAFDRGTALHAQAGRHHATAFVAARFSADAKG